MAEIVRRVKPRYPEHDSLPIPEIVGLCPRCKRGLVHKMPGTNPALFNCYTCDNGEPGLPYISLEVLASWVAENWCGELMEHVQKLVDSHLEPSI
jgi:hypothetical protein